MPADERSRPVILAVDDTPENLKNAIMLLVENPDLRLRMGQNALQKARDLFDPRKQTQKIEEIYEHVLARRSKK